MKRQVIHTTLFLRTGFAYSAIDLPGFLARENPRRARHSLCLWPADQGQRAESSAYAGERSSTGFGLRWRNSVLPVYADRGKPAWWQVGPEGPIPSLVEEWSAHTYLDRPVRAFSARQGSERSSRWPAQSRAPGLRHRTIRNPSTSKDRMRPHTTTDTRVHDSRVRSSCS